MLNKQSLVAFGGALALASATTSTVQYPSQADIQAAAATVQPHSPVSNVKGLAFDRFFQIWFENTVSLPIMDI